MGVKSQTSERASERANKRANQVGDHESRDTKASSYQRSSRSAKLERGRGRAFRAATRTATTTPLRDNGSFQLARPRP